MPSADEFLAQYQPLQAQQVQPSADEFLKQYAPQPSALDVFTSGAYAPFKPIVNNTLEAAKNNFTQTGEAMSEPILTNPNEPGWLKPIDATVRGIGKVGNAIGGTFGTMISPLVGALSASAEPMIPAEVRAISSIAGGNPNAVTPEQVHQLAMGQGGDLANAVMLGKAGEQGAASLRKQQGLAPVASPEDPLQPLYDKMKAMSADTRPRAGFLSSNSSDPMQPPAPEAYSTKDMYDQAGKYYDAADAAKAVIGAPTIQSIVSDIKAGLDKSNFDADFHPQTAKWLAKLEEKSTDQAGNPVDMEWSKVNGMRKLLNGVINDSMKQGGTEDGYQAMVARNALDRGTGGIEQADLTGGDPGAIDLTRQANTLWSAATKADDIQSILDKGQNAAVPATSYKNGFNKLANDDAKMKGYTPEEQDAIRFAAKTGIVTGALKNVGSRLMSGIVGTAAGAAAGGPLGAPVGFLAGEAAGYPFRAAANALQRGRGTAIQDLIGQRPDVQAAMNPPPPEIPAPPAPQPILGLPAPETPLITDPHGNVRPMTAAERDAAIIARQQEQAMGLSPDVRAAQQQRAITNATPMLAQSETGQWAANQGTIPFTPENAARAASALQQPEYTPAQANAMLAHATFEKAQATAMAAKQAQMDKMFQSNTETPQDLVANAAQKFQDAGLPIGQVGQALMQLLKNQEGSIPAPRFDAIGKAVIDWSRLPQAASALIPAGIAANASRPAGVAPPLQNREPLRLTITPNDKLSEPVPDNRLPPGPQSYATPPLMDRIAHAENATGNANAQNPNSTASGPLQFTNQTWANSVAKWGKQTGITLAQKNDPQAQQVMGQLLADDNARIMTSKLGRPPTDGEIYAAHFFGAPDVLKLINAAQATPDKAAIMLYPRRLVGENRNIFYDGARPRSVSEVYSLLQSKVSG